MPLVLVAVLVVLFVFRVKAQEIVAKSPCAKVTSPVVSLAVSSLVVVLTMLVCIVPDWSDVTALGGTSTVGPWSVCPFGYDCSNLLDNVTSDLARGYINSCRAFVILAVLTSIGATVLSGLYLRAPDSRLRFGLLGCHAAGFTFEWLVLGLWYGFTNDHLPSGTSFGWAGAIQLVILVLSVFGLLFAFLLDATATYSNANISSAAPQSPGPGVSLGI